MSYHVSRSVRTMSTPVIGLSRSLLPSACLGAHAAQEYVPALLGQLGVTTAGPSSVREDDDSEL